MIDWERAFDMAPCLPCKERVGRGLVGWAIMGRKKGEMWKTEVKPAEEELEWEFLSSTANSLLMNSSHYLYSFLTTTL